MKLHTQTPHESRMYRIDFGVKRSKVKVTIIEIGENRIAALSLNEYWWFDKKIIMQLQ